MFITKHLHLLTIVLFIASCSTTKSGEEVCYKNKAAIEKIQWSEAMIGTSHLILRKNHYFNYYQTMLGAYTKEVEYKGTYLQRNDTLFFRFCSDTAHRWLTERAFIDRANGKIILLHSNPRLNKVFTTKNR